MWTVLTVIFLIFFFHFVADFFCQSTWMAMNKSKNVVALTAHVCTYYVVISFGMMLLALMGVGTATGWFLYASFNAIAHFIVDFWTSKATSKLWEHENKHWFFVMIGFDQLIHTATLLFSIDLLFK